MRVSRHEPMAYSITTAAAASAMNLASLSRQDRRQQTATAGRKSRSSAAHELTMRVRGAERRPHRISRRSAQVQAVCTAAL